MNLWEFIMIAIESIRSNKMRTFLTTLGIVIGIAAVISVVAIGQGGRSLIMQELEKFGTNMFYIYVNYREGESTRPGDFQANDIKVIKKLVPEVQYLAPVSYFRFKLRGSQGEKSADIIATNADYAKIQNMNLRWGRFFSEEDEALGRRVIVLDEELAAEVFGKGNPVGQRVMLNGHTALVVGVLKKEETVLGFNSIQRAYIPGSFARNVNQVDYIHQLMGSTYSKEQVYQAMEHTKKILERRHNAPNHYTAYSMEQEMQTANKMTGIMTLVISCIAGISLLVGGIGVMNIMLVSVTERTREIGIRMALGARRKDIMVQFLIESVVLCIFGGFIGIILGYGGALLIAKLAKWPPLVSWSTALMAFLFSAVVGIFFGIYPANRAARLDPIEALRRE